MQLSLKLPKKTVATTQFMIIGNTRTQSEFFKRDRVTKLWSKYFI